MDSLGRKNGVNMVCSSRGGKPRGFSLLSMHSLFIGSSFGGVAEMLLPLEVDVNSDFIELRGVNIPYYYYYYLYEFNKTETQSWGRMLAFYQSEDSNPMKPI